MSQLDVIRAWKDEEYRLSLSDAERATLPDHPAGLIELSDADLFEAAGGTTSEPCLVTAIITAISAVTKLASCSLNCNTIAQGTCGGWSYGCC